MAFFFFFFWGGGGGGGGESHQENSTNDSFGWSQCNSSNSNAICFFFCFLLYIILIAKYRGTERYNRTCDRL